MKATAGGQGRTYQLGQGSQHITEHHYHQDSTGEGATAAVVLPVMADTGEASGFVGRQVEVARLLGLLDPTGADPEAVVVATISGLGGIGKTALAWQVAREAVGRGWFGGGAAFVDLHGYDPQTRVGPGSVFAPMLHALGVSGRAVPATVAAQAAVYHQVLAVRAQQRRPVLLVLDNAATAGQVEPLVPSGRTHRVVVTSRHTLGTLQGRHLLEVDVLEPTQAAALLDGALTRRRADDRRLRADPVAAARLAELCGYLPLALQVVAALLADEPDRPVAELIAELSQAGTRLEALTYEELTVRAAFDLSYRSLPEEQARLFRLLSVVPGPDVCTDVAAVVADQPARQVRRELVGLARAHLIQRGPQPDRWQTHDLIRFYAAEQAEAHAESDQRKVACARVLDYYLTSAHAADAHLRALLGTAVPDRFANRDQAWAWLEAERPNLVAAVTMAADAHLKIAMGLPLCLGLFLNEHRYLDDWLSTAEIAVRAARRLGDRHGEGRALCNLGHALAETGRFEDAIPTLEQALAICRELGDRNSEGLALGCLGYAVRGVGRYEDAIPLLQQSATTYHETGDRRGKGWVLGVLGPALAEVGRFEEAIACLTHALAICRETGSPEGQVLTYLGSILQDAGRFEDAISILEQAVLTCRKLGDRRYEAAAGAFLSRALRMMQRFEESIISAEQAIAIFHDAGERYNEAIVLMHLGLVLKDAGRFADARTTLKEAGNIYHATLSRPGLAVRWARRPKWVISSLEEIATFFRESGDQCGEATALGNLGFTLAKAKRFAEAREVTEQAAALFTRLGADDKVLWVRSLVDELAGERTSDTA